MLPMGSSSSAGGSDATRYNPPILKKGKACLNCRRRKMRCDGVQPICGSCARTDRAEDCEYTHGTERSTSQKLEEEVERLQSKLRHLQTTAQPSHPVTLQQPYTLKPAHIADNRISAAFQEPSPNIIRKLVDLFLVHASQYGFFLHPARFRSSVLSPGPAGHESRPSPSLLSVMYLLGIHLSQDPEIKRHEQSYLDLAIQQVSQDMLPSARHPKRRLHVIQAEVILSYYSFANKNIMQGKYHLSSAFSLGLASGMQKLLSRNTPGSALPTPTDHIEEGEQVNGCWSIFCLDKEWAVVLNHTPNFSCPDVGGARFLTPLPREIEEYESGYFQSEHRERRALHNFIYGTETSGESLSSRTLHVKASFLFGRSHALSRLLGTEMSDQQRKEFTVSYRHFRDLAVRFKASVPSLDVWLTNPNTDISRTAYVGITILNAALIRLHGIMAAQGDENSRQLRMFAAQEIFNNSINLASASWHFGHLNPIIGSAWREAFNVLFEEFKARAPMLHSWSARYAVPEDDPLRRQLRKGVSSFALYSKSCHFIDCEVKDMSTKLETIPV